MILLMTAKRSIYRFYSHGRKVHVSRPLSLPTFLRPSFFAYSHDDFGATVFGLVCGQWHQVTIRHVNGSRTPLSWLSMWRKESYAVVIHRT